jgi:hypothetical protein
MIGAYKPFDQVMHDLCDPPARLAVGAWIEANWRFKCDDYEKYKVDLVCSRNNVNRFYVEIECRQWLAGNHIPYATVHIPARKEKLFNNDLKTVYFVVSGDFKHGIYTDVENIKQSPRIEVKNSAIAFGEYFYDVPKEKWTYANLSDIF